MLLLCLNYFLTFILASAFVLSVKRYIRWWRMQKIPGPKSPFLLGLFRQIRSEPFMQPHKRWWKEVGYDAPFIRYSTLYGSNSLLIVDKEIAREILTAPAGKAAPRFYKDLSFLMGALGKGLVTLDGEEWMRHRRIIQPSFSVSFLKQCLSVNIPPKAAELVDCWSKVDDGREIEISSHFSAITLDVIGDVAFSYEFNGLKDIRKWAESSEDRPGLTDPFITAFMSSFQPSILAAVLFILGYGHFNQYINPRSRRIKKLVNGQVAEVIKKARESSSSTRKAKSLLQLLFDATDSEDGGRKFNNDELIDEMKTFLVAGHETTSTWCYWASFAMANHPDVQEKLYQEIISFAPLSKEGGNEITLEQVEQMEYFTAFLYEVLRMYPPVGFIMRYNRYEENFCGYKVQPGTRLMICPHLLHRHEKYWDDPETFLPERWMDQSENGETNGNSADGGKTRGFAFLPFSAGGRNCIGQRFAFIEAQLILAPIIRAFRLEIAPSQRETKFQFTANVTMKSKPSVRVVIKKRHATQ